MSPSELGKELEAGKFRPAYYFFGTEDYRIKEAEKALVARFLPKAQQMMNHTILSASKSNVEDILTELSMIPMLGKRQVFTITDIQSISQKQIETILSLLTPPDPNRIVIMTSPSSRTPRKTTKLFKFLDSNTSAVEFARLREQSSKGKIKSLLMSSNVEIESDALDVLAELGGGDLGGLIAEVNKLIDYIGEGGTIRKEDVLAVSSDYQGFKVYELADHAARGSFDKAMSVIDFLLRRGEKPSSLLFWMGEHFIGLYLTRNRKSPGPGKKDMSWKYKDQVGLFDNDRLEMIIKLIAEADFDLRTNTGQERLIIEKLIYNICSKSQKKANV